MGFFKSLFGGSNTPETEKEKNAGNREANPLWLPWAAGAFAEADGASL